MLGNKKSIHQRIRDNEIRKDLKDFAKTITGLEKINVIKSERRYGYYMLAVFREDFAVIHALISKDQEHQKLYQFGRYLDKKYGVSINEIAYLYKGEKEHENPIGW